MSRGAELIAVERLRQVEIEGYTPEREQGRGRELMAAASSYLASASSPETLTTPPSGWPWAAEYWKPTTPERDLVKAGALIAAAIDAGPVTA